MLYEYCVAITETQGKKAKVEAKVGKIAFNLSIS